MSTNYDYNRREEIERLISISFPELLNEIHKINIIFSDEIPPAIQKEMDIKNNKERYDVDFTIDGLLGAYFPDTKQIVIYLQGFNYPTNKIKYQIGIQDDSYFYMTLLKIVILHEIGHYWFDNFVQLDNAKTKQPDFFIDNLDAFPYEDYKGVYEWVAQMFAYLCLDKQEDKDFMVKFSNTIKYNHYHLIESDINYTGNIHDTFKQSIKLLYLNFTFGIWDSTRTPFNFIEESEDKLLDSDSVLTNNNVFKTFNISSDFTEKMTLIYAANKYKM